MTVISLAKPKTFETPAGPVTITGVDTKGPPERCVKGFIRKKHDPRITDALEYDLNGVVQAGRSDLNLDVARGEGAAMMAWFREQRRLS